MEVHIYIGFETLEVKCTQYGICSQVAFKIGGGGNNFRSGSKNPQAGAKKLQEGRT